MPPVVGTCINDAQSANHSGCDATERRSRAGPLQRSAVTRSRPWKIVRYGMASVRRPLDRYRWKFTGDGTAPAERPPWRIILVSWIGALVALGVLGWLAEAGHAPLLMAPFGASVVLLFAHPDSLLTQPRNVVGGHVLGGVIGMLSNVWLGDSWPVMAFAVATTIAATKATRSVHPPAGATAIVCMQIHAGWSFLVAPVLAGSVILVGLAAIYNNAIEHRRYPRHWW